MCEWFTFPMSGINSDFGFSEDMGYVENGVYHDWVRFVSDFFNAATLLHKCHKLWPLNPLLALCISPSRCKTHMSHNEASLKRVWNRIAMATDCHDFMHHFLEQAGKKKSSSYEDNRGASDSRPSSWQRAFVGSGDCGRSPYLGESAYPQRVTGRDSEHLYWRSNHQVARCDERAPVPGRSGAGDVAY
ncbi:hypothetical protein BKA67DRAFT_50366 [Truncatella angustata]|uniref:Uncharacterized protein n=1 Tax=Truncatella angustata TaxID=152316 RepID=A0A9P8UXX1_9PEZI|nr:uncharacterized protein BKA67DRAFT_50366 [Truncatella angustata]KAH6660400.1 hypothetical protein BKA67DRAFT_50366 [Truncatella angustata]